MAERALDNELYDNHGEIILTGSSNAYVATVARSVSAYYRGLRICGKANHTNNGAATLNLITPNSPSGIGAAAIRKAANAALVGGEIVSGKYYDFIYDDVNSVFQIENADIGTGTVTNAQLANMAQFRIKARQSSGSGVPEDLTLSEVLDFIGSAAQGDILYRGASAWARLGAGTNRQFLQTQGTGANPQYAYSGMTLLTSGSVSNQATLDIVLTSYTAFRAIKFFLTGYVPATDNTAFWIRTSSNGGSSYDSGANDYSWGELFVTASAGGTSGDDGDNLDAQIRIASGYGNASNEVAAFEITLYPSTLNRLIHASCIRFDSAANLNGSFHSGVRGGSADVNAVRFLSSSGNLTVNYAVFGMA